MLPIAIVVPVLAVAGLVVTKVRPSTLMRVAEDTVAGGTKRVARRAKRFTHDVRVEYNARLYARAQNSVRKAQAELRSKSPAELADIAAEQDEIIARADELLAKRNVAPRRAPKNASNAARRAK